MHDTLIVDSALAPPGTFPALELGLQELEAMEAPGFWSVAGYVAGAAAATSVASYIVVATLAAAT